MKSRILALLLALVMVLGMVPSMAPRAEAADYLTHLAYYTDPSALTLDNSISETVWYPYAQLSNGTDSRSFDVLWNAETLYLAIEAEANDLLVITSGAYSKTVALTGTTELAIPMADLGITVYDYKQLIPLSLSIGDMVWSGTVELSSAQRSQAVDGWQQTDPDDSSNTTNLRTKVVADGGLNISRRYGNGASTSDYDAAFYKKENMQALSGKLENTSVEFDFVVDAMPEYNWLTYIAGIYACRGFALAYTSGAINPQNGQPYSVSFGITNNGGQLYASVAFGPYDTRVITTNTGKTLGEKFHVQLLTTADGSLEIYIDGKLIRTVQGAVLDTFPMSGTFGAPYPGIRISNYGYPGRDGEKADGSEDVDFTLWNLTLGSTCGNSILDELSWDTICGENTDINAVTQDLVLPTTLDNARIPGVNLLWSSSDPSVIATDGTVNIPTETATVTLTATVAGNSDLTKQFEVTVPAYSMEAMLTEEPISADGRLTEKTWLYTEKRPFSLQDGASGTVSALWAAETAYLALEYANADTLTLSLGDSSWEIPLTAAISAGDAVTGAAINGVAELKIDLPAAGIFPEDYNEAYDLQMTLEGTNSSAQLETQSVALILAGRYLESVLSTVDVSTPPVSGKTGSSDTTGYNAAEGAWVHNAVNGVCYWAETDIAAMSDHSLNILTEMDINITAMPESNGTIEGAWSARGVYFWVSDLDKVTTTSNGYYSFANIYHKSGGALVLKSPGGTEIPLGVSVGQRFTLGYQWNADDSAVVYVNGVEKGTIPANTRYVSGAGGDVVQIRAQSPVAGKATSVNIYGVEVFASGMNTVTLEEELSAANILSGCKLSDLTNSDVLTLPGSWETKLGTFELSYISSDDCVALTKNADGSWSAAITQPNTTVRDYADLTMYANGKSRWAVQLSVAGLNFGKETTPDLFQVPFTASAVTLDGKTTEEGWSYDIKVLDDNSVSVGAFGVQWDTKNLYMAVDTNGLPLTLTVNGRTANLSGAATEGDIKEFAVPLADLGVVLQDYGTELSTVLTLGNSVWEGTLKLSSTDRFLTDGAAPRFPGIQKGTVATAVQAPTANQGLATTENGWRFYDLYDPNGNNPIGVRTYLIFSRNSGTAEEQQTYQPINDRTKSTYMEFDFYAASMPEYNIGNGENGGSEFSAHYGSYGLSWSISGARINNRCDSISMGIFNTKDGLIFAALNLATQYVPLNKHVGDQFRIGVRWELDGSLTIFVDGECIANVPDIATSRANFGDTNLLFNLIRNGTPAASGSDSMDIYISNIALGKSRGDSIFDALTEEIILAENTDAYSVTSDLNLVSSLYDDLLDITAEIQWSSSDESIIAPDGTVNRPEAGGKTVVVTAQWNGMSKSFSVYVKGLRYTSNTMVVLNDLDTQNGAGELLDTYFFTLDSDNNSIVLDQTESKRFNLITLTDGDDSNRLNESNLTIWFSDDNQTYTRVDSFKIKKDGNKIYLYDFEETARYVKVHCTEFRPAGADFTAPLEGLIAAEWNASLATATGTAVTVTNGFAEKKYDCVWTLDGTYSGNLRVLLNGELLYHYVEDSKLHVRIPEIKAGGSVTLKVVTVDDDALDIANKEYTIEVVYGTRETRTAPDAGYYRFIEALPDGSLISVQYGTTGDGIYGDPEADEYWISYAFSYDNGVTWTEPVEIEGTRGTPANPGIPHPGGIVYDPNNGRIIVQGYTAEGFVGSDMTQSRCKLRFVYSDDLGKTWHRCPEVSVLGSPATYVLSYTDPLIVSSYDGEGPGVDMVLCNGAQYGNDGTFCCRVAYTTDAGLTWTLGKDRIRFSLGEGLYNIEGGVSEATILEDPAVPGKLVLYARCQFDNVDNFAKTYSYDYGKTWVPEAELSSVYTVNTQPIFHNFNGTHLLFWGGNNVLGGNSYERMPMNVAVTYDAGETFVNIQDLYARTSLQGMTTGTRNQIINQSIANVGDTVTVVWENSFVEYLSMRIDNFTDWFYRTKNAYDSFENSDIKAEGWSAILGNPVRSDDHALEGNYAMKLSGGAAAVRSIPYLQNGTVDVDLYLERNSSLQFELESAHGVEYGKAAPIAFTLSHGTITFLGSDTAYPVDITEGWNHFSFRLALAGETPAAELYLNGEKVADIPVNADIGNYVCWADISAASVVYVDCFTVTDNDTVVVPEAPGTSDAPVEPIAIAGTTMTLGNDLALNFMVRSTDVTGSGWYAEIVHGDKVTIIEQSDWVESGDYTRISYKGLAAKQMTDEVVITIYDANNNVLAEKTDSIRSYAMRMFGKSTAAFDTVLADMLNYGAAAQVQFNYRTDELANSRMTEEQKAKATESIALTDLRVTADGYLGATLGLENNIVLNFFYNADFVGKTATVSYTDHYGVAHNYDVEVAASGNMGKVSVDQLVISDCSVAITVTIDGGSVVDSVESYCARMTDLALREPLMKFAASARSYFSH